MKVASLVLSLSLLIPSSLLSSPFTDREVAEAMIRKGAKYNIDTRILYTIASIESNFEPLAIAVETSKHKAEVLKQLASDNIKILTGRTYHSRIWLVSIYPDSYDTAVFIIHQLEKLGFGFDVGLMQINTVNFTLKEVKEMFNPEKNLEKACLHLSGCIKRYKSKKLQVECYNRGAGNLNRMLKKGGSYFPYWKRYNRHWNKYF